MIIKALLNNQVLVTPLSTFWIVIKCICLFLAIWFTIVNTVKMVYKQNIPVNNFFIQAIGITGFLILQFRLFIF